MDGKLIKRKITIILIILLTISINLIFISHNVNAKSIVEPDSSESPIHKYFTTKKILWTFDDYFIQKDHHPPHKGFDGLTTKISGYNGHVNIMVVFTTETLTIPFQNEIRNYSFIKDFGINQEKIDKSLEFFKRSNIYPQCHGWNHSENLNNANMNDAYKIINFTLWNWENNFNIMPNFFLGHSTGGNYNITLALKHFSEKYWTVYGENFRWYDADLFQNPSHDAPAIEYIGKADYVAMFDPLFGCNWGTPCETLGEAQNLFNTSSKNKEIIFIRGHPNFLNGTDQKTREYLMLWEDWIDWIYQNHDLININHSEAIYYITDRDNFRVEKISPDTFTIDLTDCEFDHRVLFTQPYNEAYYYWTLKDEKGNNIGDIYEDTFLELKSGSSYSFSTFEKIGSLDVASITNDDENLTPGFEFIIMLFAVMILFFFIFIRRKKH